MIKSQNNAAYEATTILYNREYMGHAAKQTDNPMEHGRPCIQILRCDKKLWMSVDFIEENTDFTNYKIIIVPAINNRFFTCKKWTNMSNRREPGINVQKGHKNRNGQL